MFKIDVIDVFFPQKEQKRENKQNADHGLILSQSEHFGNAHNDWNHLKDAHIW